MTLAGNIRGPAGAGALPGGAAGQVLAKNSATDFDAAWANTSFRHVQSAAATTWVVTHNLGFWPNVVAVDSTRRVIYPDISYPDINTVQLDFSAAMGGEVYLS